MGLQVVLSIDGGGSQERILVDNEMNRWLPTTPQKSLNSAEAMVDEVKELEEGHLFIFGGGGRRP